MFTHSWERQGVNYHITHLIEDHFRQAFYQLEKYGVFHRLAPWLESGNKTHLTSFSFRKIQGSVRVPNRHEHRLTGCGKRGHTYFCDLTCWNDAIIVMKSCQVLPAEIYIVLSAWCRRGFAVHPVILILTGG